MSTYVNTEQYSKNKQRHADYRWFQKCCGRNYMKHKEIHHVWNEDKSITFVLDEEEHWKIHGINPTPRQWMRMKNKMWYIIPDIGHVTINVYVGQEGDIEHMHVSHIGGS